MRDHPIPPVTEPLQFRAIGIVRAVYRPEDNEKFTRGKLIDSEGIEVDAVVLGRVITLMRRHLPLEIPHLWVVYPRCKDAGHLHLQISGIWEPSTLSKDEIQTSSKNNDEKLDLLPEGDDYFSIRGELIYTRPEDNQIVLKIRQKARPNAKTALPFKVFLKGKIPLENLRNFLSLNVRRKGQILELEDYELIGPIPKKISKSRSNRENKKNNNINN